VKKRRSVEGKRARERETAGRRKAKEKGRRGGRGNYDPTRER